METTTDPLHLLSESLKKYLGEINSLRDKSNEQEKKIGTLEGNLKQVKGDLADRTSELKISRTESDAQKKQIDELGKELDQKNNAIETQSSANKNLSAENDKLKSQLGETLKELDKVKANNQKEAKKEENT
ncbi:MAG: hypothetical protein IH948_05115 [Bacteroidetes bacterium]|nr:hypothetical protein [Bacteroidota bacterium]